MTATTSVLNANDAWLRALGMVLSRGRVVSPKGSRTLEVPHLTSIVDMRHPVITIPERHLNYRFLAAEAYWILSGDDTVAGIAPYNTNISKFSDDGVTFAGAYGPRIKEQLAWVVAKLIEDPETRQAGLTIWKPCPPKSLDVPCTVAIWFQLRDRRLNVHVLMRSNDLWLGFPYDIFNFSMLGHQVAGMLRLFRVPCEVGDLYHTAVSAHLYDEHVNPAALIYDAGRVTPPETKPVPTMPPTELMHVLMALRERGNEVNRWWV